MRGTPWVVVEADDKQTIQTEFAKGEIVDQFRTRVTRSSSYRARASRLFRTPCSMGRSTELECSGTSARRACSLSSSPRSRDLRADLERDPQRSCPQSRFGSPGVLPGGRASRARRARASAGNGR